MSNEEQRKREQALSVHGYSVEPVPTDPGCINLVRTRDQQGVRVGTHILDRLVDLANGTTDPIVVRSMAFQVTGSSSGTITFYHLGELMDALRAHFDGRTFLGMSAGEVEIKKALDRVEYLLEDQSSRFNFRTYLGDEKPPASENEAS